MLAKYKRQNVEPKADIPTVSQHWVDIQLLHRLCVEQAD